MTETAPRPAESDSPATATAEAYQSHADQTTTPPVPPATAPMYAATPGPVYPPARPTNVLSIITLVLGVLGFAIAPVITGHISLSQIKRTGEDGKVMAIIGLVLGYVGVAFYAIAFIFTLLLMGFGLLAIIFGASQTGYYDYYGHY